MAQPIYRILGPDRKESGQVSADFVRQWIAQGLANAETMVRTEERTQWKPLGEFAEFLEDLEMAGAAPLPQPAAVAQDRNLAVISLLLGVLSVCAGVFTGIPAILTGQKARRQIRENPAQFGGARLAMAGVVLGYFSLVLTALWASALLTTLENVRERNRSELCVGNLKQVGLAARLYGKYNRRVFPPSFLAMSNELGRPLVLHCPDDASRPIAGSWTQFTPEHSSYEYLHPGAKEAEVMNQVVFRCPIHGHLGFGSGKVLDATRKWAPVIESY